MKAVVDENGVLIPRRLLRGVKEVEIRKEGRSVVVEPASTKVDSIFKLGRNPVHSGVPDGAQRHDVHLYGSR